jgi:diaminopimelate decarboxylase
MNHFHYRGGRLFAEDVDLTKLAELAGTPLYVYSSATLERHYRVFADAFPAGTLIAFSVKANGNLAVLKTLGQLGAGADVVSGGELKKALAAGIPPRRIVFSGVGKTPREMKLGLEAGIHQFNVESEPELEALNETALRWGRARRSPFASIRTSMPARMPRSRRGRRKRNSAFPGAAPATPTRTPRSSPASRSWASTCISAAR